MTDTEQFALAERFRREVKACKTLGFERMQQILFDQFHREPLAALIMKAHAEWLKARK